MASFINQPNKSVYWSETSYWYKVDKGMINLSSPCASVNGIPDMQRTGIFEILTFLQNRYDTQITEASW